MQELLDVQDPAQIHALSHPLRLRLLDLLARAPATNRQLATALEQSPSKVFFHMQRLLRAGLIRPAGTRVLGGVVEKYYEPVARRFLVDRTSPASGSEPRAGAVLATAVAEYRAALGRFGAAGADYDAARLTLHLRPGDAEKARDLIWALLDDLRALERPDGTPFALTCLLHPRVEEPDRPAGGQADPGSS